ncbi:MAG TPA: hypothetical protein V6C85_35105 [Allocoleopsis sp.]
MTISIIERSLELDDNSIRVKRSHLPHPAQNAIAKKISRIMMLFYQ